MVKERRLESNGGLITGENPFIDIQTAQRMFDRINSFPVIQEIHPETGIEYRRTLYLSTGDDQKELHLYFEKYPAGWTYLSIWKKEPGIQAHLAFPIRVRNGRNVSRIYSTRVLEWFQSLEPGIAPMGIEEMKLSLVQECLNTPSSLEAALKDYPRIARRSIEPEFGIKLLDVHLLKGPSLQLVK